MPTIKQVDPAHFTFHFPWPHAAGGTDAARLSPPDRTITIQPAEHKPGPPERIDGLTAGIVHMTRNPPHNGEMHPDGDELLYIISGRVEVIGDSDPNPLPLATGEACIVPKGEWHRINLLEPTTLLHITPGPNHKHRPLAAGS